MRGHRLLAWPILLLALAAGCEPAARAAGDQCQASARDFWTDFRAGLLSADPAKVSPMVAFPLPLEGTLDEDNQAPLAEADFRRRLAGFLDADSGLRESDYPVRQLVADTTLPGEVACTGEAGEFRVGNLLFQRSGGEWRLTKVYVE